jgi:hypothetical protein
MKKTLCKNTVFTLFSGGTTGSKYRSMAFVIKKFSIITVNDSPIRTRNRLFF